MLVVNQLYPERFAPGSPQDKVLSALLGAGAIDDRLRALALHGDFARSRRALNERYLELLAAAVPAPQVHLPLLFTAQLGPDHIQQLSETIEATAA